MCHQAKNMEKFGVTNVDRKERYTFCKKNFNENRSDSNNSDTNSDEDEQNNDKNEKIYIKYISTFTFDNNL